MGHFEQGKWVEDEPELTFDVHSDFHRVHETERWEAFVRVHVDDSELRELKETLEQVQDLIAPPVTVWGRLRWLLFGNVE